MRWFGSCNAIKPPISVGGNYIYDSSQARKCFKKSAGKVFVSRFGRSSPRRLDILPKKNQDILRWKSFQITHSHGGNEEEFPSSKGYLSKLHIYVFLLRLLCFLTVPLGVVEFLDNHWKVYLRKILANAMVGTLNSEQTKHIFNCEGTQSIATENFPQLGMALPGGSSINTSPMFISTFYIKNVISNSGQKFVATYCYIWMTVFIVLLSIAIRFQHVFQPV